MALTTRTPKQQQTAATAPANRAAGLTHAQLRVLPVGWDQPGSDTFIPDDLLGYFVAVASDPQTQRNMAATLQARGAFPAQDDRGVPIPQPSRAKLETDFLLAKARTLADADAQAAANAARWQRTQTCPVCGVFSPDAPLESFVVVDGVDVVRMQYGMAGRHVRIHTACAIALADHLRARVRVDPARVQAYAAQL